MRYTDEAPPPSTRVGYADAVVVFSVKAASLLLTGPSRSMVILDPVNYEVELKVKGDTPCQDKLLSLLLIEDKYHPPSKRCQGVHHHTYSSKLSTVGVTVGHLERTVEATPSRSESSRAPGQVSTAADSSRPCMASLDGLDMVLLDSRDGAVTVKSEGSVELSRRVVSVEENGELRISVDAWQGEACGVANGQVSFVPRRSGRSKDLCDVAFCRMEVTVTWSLVVNW